MATSWQAVGIGKWASGTWQGEMASVSISGVGADSGGSFPGVINGAVDEFNAVASGVTGTSTHMTWTHGWDGSAAGAVANQRTIGEAMWAYLNWAKLYIADTFQWQEVRVSAINADGSVVNGASVGSITAPIAGTLGVTFPPQTAIVASLVTGGRGPRCRGRIYLPCHHFTSSGDSLIGSSDRGAVNTNTKTLINAINAITGIRAGVVSRTHGTWSDITAVRCGDELDTQRRRRYRRRENYTVLSV